MSRTSLNRSSQGRAIVVSDKFPTQTVLHTMQPTTLKQPNVHDVHLEISNPQFGRSVIVELHYNSGVIYVTVPPLHTVPIHFAIEGDSPEETVTNQDLIAYLHATARDDAQVHIMGSVEIG